MVVDVEEEEAREVSSSEGGSEQERSARLFGFRWSGGGREKMQVGKLEQDKQMTTGKKVRKNLEKRECVSSEIAGQIDELERLRPPFQPSQSPFLSSLYPPAQLFSFVWISKLVSPLSNLELLSLLLLPTLLLLRRTSRTTNSLARASKQLVEGQEAQLQPPLRTEEDQQDGEMLLSGWGWVLSSLRRSGG